MLLFYVGGKKKRERLKKAQKLIVIFPFLLPSFQLLCRIIRMLNLPSNRRDLLSTSLATVSRSSLLALIVLNCFSSCGIKAWTALICSAPCVQTTITSAHFPQSSICLDRADPSEVLRGKLPPVQFVSAGKHDILVQVQLSMLPLLLNGGCVRRVHHFISDNDKLK